MIKRKKLISMVLCLSLMLGMVGVIGQSDKAIAAEEQISLDSEDTVIEISASTNVYTGVPIDLLITVWCNGNLLTEGVDYTCRVYDGDGQALSGITVNGPGTYTVVVDGMGKYKDRNSSPFTVTGSDDEFKANPFLSKKYHKKLAKCKSYICTMYCDYPDPACAVIKGGKVILKNPKKKDYVYYKKSKMDKDGCFINNYNLKPKKKYTYKLAKNCKVVCATVKGYSVSEKVKTKKWFNKGFKKKGNLKKKYNFGVCLNKSGKAYLIYVANDDIGAWQNW